MRLFICGVRYSSSDKNGFASSIYISPCVYREQSGISLMHARKLFCIRIKTENYATNNKNKNI